MCKSLQICENVGQVRKTKIVGTFMKNCGKCMEESGKVWKCDDSVNICEKCKSLKKCGENVCKCLKGY